ncbi:MAG: hypothetical protein WDM88_10740 [Galbitalea sp.]
MTNVIGLRPREPDFTAMTSELADRLRERDRRRGWIHRGIALVVLVLIAGGIGWAVSAGSGTPMPRFAYCYAKADLQASSGTVSLAPPQGASAGGSTSRSLVDSVVSQCQALWRIGALGGMTATTSGPTQPSTVPKLAVCVRGDGRWDLLPRLGSPPPSASALCRRLGLEPVVGSDRG